MPCAFAPMCHCRLCRWQGHCRGEGLGSLLASTRLRPPRLGLTMQFNLVGEYQPPPGIPLLEKRNGFRTIGTLPGLFATATRLRWRAYVMVQSLLESPAA